MRQVLSVAWVLLFATTAFAASKRRNAYATIHYEGTPSDAEYLLGLRTTLLSVRRTEPNADIIVLLSPTVTKETRAILRQEAVADRLIDIPDIENPYIGSTLSFSRFTHTLNKLHLWNLTEYDRVVYLDADTIALQNMDELFMCGHFCVVYQNPCNFHTGMVVLRPSAVTFNDMLRSLANLPSYDGADQGFFVSYFPYDTTQNAPLFRYDPSHRHPRDDPIMRLAPGYNLNGMWYFERKNWDLYLCSDRFQSDMGKASLEDPPGLSLTYPIAPFLKPWYWWAYAIFDDTWLIWQAHRLRLGDSFLGDVAWVLLQYGAALLLMGGLTYALPCSRSNRREAGLPAWYAALVRPLGLYATAGVHGVGLTLLSVAAPLLVVPYTLPPLLGWSLYLGGYCLYQAGWIWYLLACQPCGPSGTAEDLCQRSFVGALRLVAKDAAWCGVMFIVLAYHLYPQLPFIMGKLVAIVYLTLVMGLLQVWNQYNVWSPMYAKATLAGRSLPAIGGNM